MDVRLDHRNGTNQRCPRFPLPGRALRSRLHGKERQRMIYCPVCEPELNVVTWWMPIMCVDCSTAARETASKPTHTVDLAPGIDAF